MSDKPTRVLLVEDDEICQRASSLMLEYLGCSVAIAESGEAALRFLDQPYDLIVMDLGLPDVDGFRLVERIRKEKPQNGNTPIVSQTANLTDLYQSKAKKCGIKALYRKPVSSDQFREILERYT
ncbi:MAG: response regulator [Gammaproteobacteria bacterium]|nr:response regulator [Gammaproteobacteria bacterium]